MNKKPPAKPPRSVPVSRESLVRSIDYMMGKMSPKDLKKLLGITASIYTGRLRP